tara:strand:- start:53 stop:754 length:702 start_codon:yes stop_codon:yes gene_type:complete
MSLKIIGAGFGRTGTLSLKVALEQLGYGPCHHMKEVMLNNDQAEWFSQASKGVEVDWHEVFNKYSSAVDWPAAAYYQELADSFPDAKIVLGVRDPDAWYESVENTIFRVIPNFPKWVRFIFPRSDKVFNMIEKTIWQGEFSGQFEDKGTAIQVFNERIETIKKMFPPERLLIHTSKDGWEPLCEFLDVEIPETPYPWVNDSAKIKRAILIMKILQWLPLAIFITISISLIRTF